MSSAVTDHAPISRRTAVTAVAATAALLPLAAQATPARAADGPAFLHGVASGDPLPDGVLLWTRLTPTPEAVPGSGLGVPVKAATYPLSASAATEFVVTSVTSDNLDDILHVAPHTISLAAVAALRAANRHVKWIDMDSHGYGVLDITSERAQIDYYAVSDRTDPAATASWARSYRARSGTQRIERADAPVR
ncbi:PhoD-like phosphatase N-terminal domain-containing protein [Streptomyces sp. NPDC059679]|uniref:PhoD-like phosphatase N-terminal domain-containing protein n=1 Tax=Streptomyces sp. NPDC059679 TaxID=3346903 RepID=UPI0036CD9F5D